MKSVAWHSPETHILGDSSLGRSHMKNVRFSGVGMREALQQPFCKLPFLPRSVLWLFIAGKKNAGHKRIAARFFLRVF